MKKFRLWLLTVIETVIALVKEPVELTAEEVAELLANLPMEETA